MEESDLKLTYFGGVLKKTYYTPDGREIKTPPAMRGYVNKTTGEEGVRDANFDKGWLENPPENPKPHCKGCGKWHDTLEEVEKCMFMRQSDNEKWAKEKLEEDRIDKLENDLADIKSMLSKILEVKNG